MKDDEIENLYDTDALRLLTHRVALERPDGDEFCIRVIAMIQLVEAQRETISRLTNELNSHEPLFEVALADSKFVEALLDGLGEVLPSTTVRSVDGMVGAVTQLRNTALNAADWLEARTDKEARRFHAARIRHEIMHGSIRTEDV